MYLKAELLPNGISNTSFVLLVMKTSVKEEMRCDDKVRMEGKLHILACYLGTACSSQY